MEYNEENFKKLLEAHESLAVEIKDDSEDFSADFKSGFDDKFILKSEAKEDEGIINAVFGKTAAIIEQGAKKQAKEIGVEFEDGIFKDKKVTEVVDLVFEKTNAHFDLQLKDLKKSSSKSDDKQLIELQGKHDVMSAELKQRTESQEQLVKDVEAEKLGRVEDKKSFKSEFEFKSAYGKANLIDNMTDLQHKGFNQILKDKYDFKVNDKGVTVPMTKDEKLVEHPSKRGVYFSLQDVIEHEAKEQGINKNNNGTHTPPVDINAPAPGAVAGVVIPPRKIAKPLR